MKQITKITAWVLCFAVLTALAGCSTAPQTGTTAPTQNQTTTTTQPTTPTTQPETTPVTEPQVTGAINFFSLYMSEDFENIFSITAYPNENGSIHIEYTGQERKVTDMDASVVDTIILALQDSGLEALHGQDIYETGDASASMYVEFVDGSFLAVGYSGVIPEAFAQGYDKMDAFFQKLLQDVPVYVPVPAVLGEVDQNMQDVIMRILTGSHVEGLDYFYITQPPRDEQFLPSVGLSSEEGIGTAVLCGATMMTTPFSIAVVTLEEGADPEAVCEDFQANLDWTKWVCVAPSGALIATKDNMVLCMLAPDVLYSQIQTAVLTDGWTTYTTQTNPNLQ